MHRLLSWTGALVLALGVTACKSEETPPVGTPTLSISPTPRTLVDDGTRSEVRVSAFDAEGKVGTGNVELTAPAGTFDNDQKTVTLTLLDGKAVTGFRCLRAADTGCVGSVRLVATWNGTTGGTSLQVAAKAPNNNTPDGGTNPPDGGTNPPDGGTDPTAPVAGEPANIVFLSSSAKPVLGIRSSNLDVSTPITFVVTDLKQVPVPKVTVNFDVRGAGGVALSSYSAQTNGAGQATTTLLSGDEVGIATVRATVANSSLAASTLGTPIVGARPSDEGFTVNCDKINLAANATETPPRQDLVSNCQAQLVDRFKNPVVLSTSVNWYAEAGSIQSPIKSNGPGTGGDGSEELGDGIVVSEFRSAGKWPPADVTPLAGERVNGRRNARDMLVTIIAVTSGEEEFHDGSGVSKGSKDGQWNPGEWFVDVPEPFVDENDNQAYDLGEPFIDTQRLNCTTGQREPKNGKWDAPNGCWDGDILIWRPTHILYSGFATVLGGMGSTFEYTSSYDNAAQGYVVGKGSTRGIGVTVFDDFFNPISPEGAEMKVEETFTAGKIEFVPDARLPMRYYGQSIFHERLQTTDEPTASRGYTTDGTLCDPTREPPAAAATNPRLARCVRQYRIGNFIAGNHGVIKLIGASASSTEPAQTNTITVSIGNSYSSTLDLILVTMQ